MVVALVTAEMPQAPPVQPVKLAFFEDVQDVPSLIEKLRSGTLAVGMVDARTILSTKHLLAAVLRALNDHSNGRMKTRNVHSEVLLSLNLNNNIVEAYRKFGVQPDTRSLLAVKIGDVDDDRVQEELEGVIHGRSMPVTDENLAKASDLDTVRRLYKLGKKSADLTTGERAEMEAYVIESIALRGAL